MRLLLLFLFLYSLPVLSHQSSVTSSQNEIRWNYTSTTLKVTNTASSLSSSTAFIDQSIAEWNNASAFDILRVGTSNNQIRFSNDFSYYGSAVVGVTEVGYAPSGIINSATILLNEEHYDFTATPGLALSNTVYLKDVVTHELGHFIGLSHSEVLNSSMFYQNFPGQSELSADDKAGIRSKYDNGYGRIYGSVQGGNYIGILGVHVQAISRNTGQAVATITDENGYFNLVGLDLNDTYYLYTSKLKNLASLPSYFSNVQTQFCPAAYVASFYSQCGRENDGLPQGITLSESQMDMDVGIVSINCSLRIQEDYVYQKLQSSFSAVEIFNYSQEPRNEKSYVGYFKNSDLNTTSFTGEDKLSIDLRGYSTPSNKYLKLRLVSQPLGNAIEYNMTVKRNGFVVSGPTEKSINPEGTFNLDLVSMESLSPTASTNIFEVVIQARKLTSSNANNSIPDLMNFGSVQNTPYLLIMSLESIAGPELDTGSNLSDNSSCLDAPFTYAVNNSTAQSDEATTTGAKAAAAATCGTIDPPSGPGSGPGTFMVLLSLGFILSILPSRLTKRDKKILS